MFGGSECSSLKTELNSEDLSNRNLLQAFGNILENMEANGILESALEIGDFFAVFAKGNPKTPVPSC